MIKSLLYLRDIRDRQIDREISVDTTRYFLYGYSISLELNALPGMHACLL